MSDNFLSDRWLSDALHVVDGELVKMRARAQPCLTTDDVNNWHARASDLEVARAALRAAVLVPGNKRAVYIATERWASHIVSRADVVSALGLCEREGVALAAAWSFISGWVKRSQEEAWWEETRRIGAERARCPVRAKERERVRSVPCPRCAAKVGRRCEMPSGGKIKAEHGVHRARVELVNSRAAAVRGAESAEVE